MEVKWRKPNQYDDYNDSNLNLKDFIGGEQILHSNNVMSCGITVIAKGFCIYKRTTSKRKLHACEIKSNIIKNLSIINARCVDGNDSSMCA